MPRKRPAHVDDLADAVKKRPVGRPPAEERERIWIRVSENEMSEWTAAAERAGVDAVSTWIRQTCNRAARK